jgi:hypothetical protein
MKRMVRFAPPFLCALLFTFPAAANPMPGLVGPLRLPCALLKAVL